MEVEMGDRVVVRRVEAEAVFRFRVLFFEELFGSGFHMHQKVTILLLESSKVANMPLRNTLELSLAAVLPPISENHHQLILILKDPCLHYIAELTNSL